MSDAKTNALRQVPLLSRCSKKEIEFVASRTDEVDVVSGRELTRQGHPADSFYMLLEGEADVLVDGQPRATLRAGDFFGEISMVDRGPATATVVTTTPARLMVMSHSQFLDAIKGSDELLSQVMAAAGRRLRADVLAREAEAAKS